MSQRQPRRGNGGGVVIVLLLGLVVLAACGYAALYLMAGDRVPPGTSVSGVAIGGLHPGAARARLHAELDPRARRPIQVTGGGTSTRVEPGRSGITLDVAASVHAAGGGQSLAPARLWHYYTGGQDLQATVDVDGSRLEDAVSDLAAQVDRPAVEGAVSFEAGKPVATRAVDGRRLVRAGTRDALVGAFLGTTTARVPVTVLPPRITGEAVQRALESFARPATSGPVRLVLAGHAVRATPARFTRAITMTPDGGRLTPTLDLHELLTQLGPAMTKVVGAPRPARIVIAHGRPVVVPARTGLTLDPRDLRHKFLRAVVRPLGARRVRIEGDSATASFTTADARRLRVAQRVSTYRTRFPYAQFRNHNLRRAAELVDGTLLRPGETFSLDQHLGRPTHRNGFTPGYEISGGVFREVAGGGVSQLATTLYNTMFFAGLDDVQHQLHAAYGGRLPLGRQVGVDFAEQDLRFRNDSPYGVLVTAHVTRSTPSRQGTVQVSMWSTRRWDVSAETGRRYAERVPRTVHRHGAGCESAVGHPGFSVRVVRVFRRPGSAAVARRERTTTVYEPSSTVVCDGT